MRHFLFEDKPYRISPYFKRRKKEQDSAVALAKLIKRLTPRSSYVGEVGNKSSGGGITYTRRSFDTRQKCTVKVHNSRSKEAHLYQLKEYLVKEGKGIDGGKPELYGTDLEEYQNNMVDTNFRIILSPQSDKIDLKDMTEKFVKTLEQQTGYSFYWQAANHYDTPHPHAHLLINGKDKNGKEITKFPPDFVKTFMREYARNICTAQIGHRTASEIAIEKEKELEASRFTRLDEKLKEMSGETFKIIPNYIYSDRQRVLTRLENLRKLGMCTYENGAYNLSPQWEDNLRANARYNTFLKARSELKQTDPSKLKVYTGEHGTITGKVTKIFSPEDDFSNNHAVIVECPDGKAYFVPLFKKPEFNGSKVANGDKSKIMMGIMEGDSVSIETFKTAKGRLTPVFRKTARAAFSRPA